jgi:hypothetical protein
MIRAIAIAAALLASSAASAETYAIQAGAVAPQSSTCAARR